MERNLLFLQWYDKIANKVNEINEELLNKYESFAKVENVSKYYQFWSEMFEFNKIYDDDVTTLIMKSPLLYFMILSIYGL